MSTTCPSCKRASSSPYVCTECGAALPPPIAPRPTATGNSARVPVSPGAVRTTKTGTAAPVPAGMRQAPDIGVVPSSERHSLSPEEILRLQNLDRARLRRRLFQEFAMAVTALVVIGIGTWVFVFMKPRRQAPVSLEDAPIEVRDIVTKRILGRDEIVQMADVFLRFADDVDTALAKSGVAKAAVAADFKEKWSALEGARLGVVRNVRVRDRGAMDELAAASAHLGVYLDSFAGWKPDEKGAELQAARTGFANLTRGDGFAGAQR